MDPLQQQARDVLDRVRYVALGTTDEDGWPRVSPVYFVHHGYADLYWVSYGDTHHSANIARDDRVSGVVFDATVPPGPRQTAAYVVGRAREIPADELDDHLSLAFDAARGGRAFTRDELTDLDDPIRLYLLHVEQCDVHVRAGDPGRGTGRDRRVLVNPSG